MYRLVFLTGRMKGRRVAVQQGAVLIGRDSTCQLDLADDDEVSHQHAVIEQRANGIFIRDLGALNPVEVNGKKIKEAELKDGDRIEIGRTQLLFQLIEGGWAGSRRRLGKVQALTFGAVILVLVLEVVFMLSFHLWQGGEIADIQPPAKPPEPPTETVKTAAAADTQQPAAPAEPAAATTGAATAAASEVDEEMRALREQVAALRQQITNLATTVTGAPPAQVATQPAPPASASAPASDPPATAAVAQAAAAGEAPPQRTIEEDPLFAKAKELHEAALVEMRKGDFVKADEILERIQIMAPEFLATYVERARVAERRGQLARAGEFWTEVMKRSVGRPIYEIAAAERQRVAREELTRRTVAGPTQALAKAETKLPRRVRIAEVQREKFQATAEYEEMRVLRISLKLKPRDVEIEPDAVQVLVTFYDRSLDTKEIMPTRVSIPEKTLRVEGSWLPGETKSVSAAYVVPAGFRGGEQAEIQDRRAYEGYRVQVFYKDDLQDDVAMPRTLLQLPAPALPLP